MKLAWANGCEHFRTPLHDGSCAESAPKYRWMQRRQLPLRNRRSWRSESLKKTEPFSRKHPGNNCGSRKAPTRKGRGKHASAYRTGTFSDLRAVAVARRGRSPAGFRARENCFFNQARIEVSPAPPSDASAAAAMQLHSGTNLPGECGHRSAGAAQRDASG